MAWCVQRYLAFRFCNFALSDVPWYDYISPPQRPNPTDEDGSGLKDPAVIPRAQLGFSFMHLGAVLDFVLPEVGHVQQCRCVSSKEYYRPSASTTGGHVPVEEMPYNFYKKTGDIKATFGASAGDCWSAYRARRARRHPQECPVGPTACVHSKQLLRAVP